MRWSAAPALVAAAVTLGGCFHFDPIVPPPPRPLPAPADAGTLALTRPAVERLLAAEVARLGLPSLAFGVVTRGGLVYFVGLGERDGGGTPVTAETVYRIGSITKTITGMALLQLRDAGKLAFDDPVARYVPELATARAPTADSGPIRIRHLVTHASGLPRVGSLDYADGRHEVTRLELREAAAGAVLDFAPGTRNVYSNLGMALAGPLIARAAGEPYRDYVQRHILAPLGMTRTVWEPEAVPEGLLAKGWKEKDGGGFGWCGWHWRLGAAEAMGGLYSNVADLSRYVAFQLSAWPPRDGPDEGPLRRSSVRESHVVAGFTLPSAESFGVNWMVRDDPGLGHLVFHNGATEGYRAAIFMLPEWGLGVIALGPGSDALEGIARKALEIAAGDRRPDTLGAPARRAFAQVRALLHAASPAAVEKSFAPQFLKSVPVDKVLGLLDRVRERAGACPRVRVLRAETPSSAQIEMVCERGRVRLSLEADPSPPHLILGFTITVR